MGVNKIILVMKKSKYFKNIYNIVILSCNFLTFEIYLKV